MKNNLISLTQQLISIPSWVDDKTNESALGGFCYQYLKQNPSLRLTKQVCVGNRFNLIARNNIPIDTLVVGHIDTVQPSQSWTKNPVKPEIIGDKLYGLGSSDMKSGIATMLNFAVNSRLKPNTMFLFYIDEEYDFLGMKKFIEVYQDKIRPKQIISLDGSNLSITNGCRGLIEISCTIKGQSGHAARPQSGINAIVKSYQIINRLFGWLSNFIDPELGPTVANLAYISGGQFQGWDKDNLMLGKQGNVIPDICQFIIDIRPSVPSLTAQKIIDFIQPDDYSIRHDLGSWLTPKNTLKITGLPKSFNRLDQTGYIDVQMLWQAFAKIPCLTIGAGNSSMAHKPDEYVEVNKLLKLNDILAKILLIS